MLKTDHVGIDMTNKPEFIFVWLGFLSMGAVPVLINFNLTSRSLMHCIKAADVSTLIFDSEIASNVKDIKEDISAANKRYICWVDPADMSADLSWSECVYDHVLASQSAQRPPESLRAGFKPTDLHMLMFTSGTTGLPKPANVTFVRST